MSTSMTATSGSARAAAASASSPLAALPTTSSPGFACKQSLERVQKGRIVVDEQNPDRLSFHRV
jgi:predicted dinucleotide-binding enzyme